MKNKKGFTLIEMLAVISILIIIITIVTSKVFKQLKTAENVTDKEQVSALINTAKIYMNQNSNLLPEEKSLYIISLNELKESGLIQKSQILNPSTNEELTGCVVVRYDGSKYKYEYKEDNCDKTVLVTFDPQGGQIDETSKIVTIDEEYGELPIPTREGYTFMGWNGKNMFDEETILMAISGAVHENGYYVFPVINAHRSYGGITSNSYLGNKQMNIIFKENTQYTLTINGYSEYIESNNRHCTLYYGFFLEGGKTMGAIGAENTYILTNNPNTTIDNISFSYGIGGKAYISYIQLEEGNVATPYEPYYITSDTTVVQEQNHTLKAIWQANS